MACCRSRGRNRTINQPRIGMEICVNQLSGTPYAQNFHLDRASNPGFSEYVVCQLDFWHMRCGAGHCGNLDHEPGERFAFVSLFDVDGSLAAILLFYLTRWRSGRHGGSQANDVCDDHLVRAGSGRLGLCGWLKVINPYVLLAAIFFDWDWFCLLYSGLDIGPARNCF